VCIGVELVSSPNLLILDEPTSGLDSFTAFSVIKTLNDLAKEYFSVLLFSFNKCIIMTIHQPSADIFALINRLILLKDGNLIYQGLSPKIIAYMNLLNMKVPK
jgi:ABC-type multidrug transport system ATPase subunit